MNTQKHDTEMTQAGKEILEGLNEVLADVKGEEIECRVHQVITTKIDVKAVRKKTGLTQEAFAQTYGFPLGSLKNWEGEHRSPTGAAKAYLMVINERPNVVRDALTSAMSV